MRSVLRQLTDPPDLAVRAGHRQLLREYHGSQAQRFDIEQDPGEMRDVAAAHPEVVASLQADAVSWHEAVPADLGAELARRDGEAAAVRQGTATNHPGAHAITSLSGSVTR